MKATKNPTIEIERLLLRKVVASDIDNIFEGLSHPDVVKYYGVSFKTLEATKEQMTFYTTLEKEETGIWFAVCSNDDKTFYGACGFNNLSKKHNKAEIGFWLLIDFWGQGIMKEAVPLVCKYGFDKLGLHRIEGFVESDNINCKRLLSKLDFRYEGTIKDCEIKKNGKFISLEIYAKIRDG